MTARRWRHRVGFMLIAWLICPIAGIANQDALARAKDLYLSASYDEALVILERLQTEKAHDTGTEIAQYRVFCLLALNRGDEAQAAIEGIVKADPFYRPSETLTSPRIRTIFQNTRKALLPSVVQHAYAEAKASFEKKDPRAVDQFDRVLALIDDPDSKGVAQLSDLRTVVSGFRDLSKALAAPLPASPIRAAAQSPTVGSPNASADRTTAAPRETSPAAPAQEPAFTPPVVLSQPLPRWAPQSAFDARLGFKGAISVMIDEKGNVTSAALRQSVHPQYDDELLKLARSWKYRPAMLNGVPTSYLKVVEIQLQPVR